MHSKNAVFFVFSHLKHTQKIVILRFLGFNCCFDTNALQAKITILQSIVQLTFSLEELKCTFIQLEIWLLYSFTEDAEKQPTIHTNKIVMTCIENSLTENNFSYIKGII